MQQHDLPSGSVGDLNSLLPRLEAELAGTKNSRRMYRTRRGLVPKAEIDGRLIYAGSVGTCWSFAIPLGRSIRPAKLQRIASDASPFVAVPRPNAKDARWTEPELGGRGWISQLGLVTAGSAILLLRGCVRISQRRTSSWSGPLSHVGRKPSRVRTETSLPREGVPVTRLPAEQSTPAVGCTGASN